MLHRHAVHKHPVERPVAIDECRPGPPDGLAEGVVHGRSRQPGLGAVGESLQAPEKSKEKAGPLHAINDRITVAGRIVSVGPTPSAYAHGFAIALPEDVEWVLARPTGVGRALATYQVPIEWQD